MAERAKPKTGSWGPTAWVLILSFGVFLVSLPYKWVVAPALAAENYPFFAADRVIDGLRKQRTDKGAWPERLDPLVKGGSFKGLGEVVVATDGRSVEVASNVYVYYPVDAEHVSIWVFPAGEHADKGYTHYLLVGRNAFRHWAGEPFKVEQVKQALKLARPSESQLASLRLREVFEEAKSRKRGFFSKLGGLLSGRSKEKSGDSSGGR